MNIISTKLWFEPLFFPNVCLVCVAPAPPFIHELSLICRPSDSTGQDQRFEMLTHQVSTAVS